MVACVWCAGRVTGAPPPPHTHTHTHTHTATTTAHTHMHTHAHTRTHAQRHIRIHAHCKQVVMGYELPRDELQRLSDLFSVLGVGLLAWPYLDLPFTPFRRSGAVGALWRCGAAAAAFLLAGACWPMPSHEQPRAHTSTAHTYAGAHHHDRSMNAKRELVAFFQEGVNNARQQLAAGQQVPGVLGRLVAAQDEEGNRCACWACRGAKPAQAAHRHAGGRLAKLLPSPARCRLAQADRRGGDVQPALGPLCRPRHLQHNPDPLPGQPPARARLHAQAACGAAGSARQARRGGHGSGAEADVLRGRRHQVWWERVWAALCCRCLEVPISSL
jgi:hypothetical protein